MSWVLLLSFVVGFPPAARGEWKPEFPPPPRLAATAEELAQFIASADSEGARTQAAREADALLSRSVPIPSGPGNWIFYYACKEDGSALKALSPDEHQCPRCQKIFTDERTVASYRCQQHYDLEHAALRLGWAYAYSGNHRHAEQAKRILVSLADVYDTYPDRWDRWGRKGFLAWLGGRRYAQSLDEAVGAIRLAKAYDLARTSTAWSEAEKKHVEEDFFRPTANTLLRFNQGINNHQTWYNAGLMAIASVLGDAALVEKVLIMRGGFLDQLERSIGSDGLWYEGTMAYHNYALQAMVEIVDAGRRMGLPLHEQARFRAMIEAPFKAAYPNGQFPAINDSDLSNLSAFRSHFLWAWKAYRDPLFAQAYAQGNAQALEQLLGAGAKPEAMLPSVSAVLPDAGLARLQQGRGPAAVCAFLDYGPHGGGHGHFDKLNLMIFTLGREWLLDPGRLSYSHKEYQTWVKHTAAHNTVTLGGRSQNASAGRLLWFQTAEDFSACAAEALQAYPGASLRRYLFLTPSMLLDVFDVKAAKPVQIDWFAHALSQKVTPAEDRWGTGEEKSLGKTEGYPHLEEGRVWNVSGDSRWDFEGDNQQRLRLWLSAAGEEQIFTAKGIGYHVGQKVPCLMRRRTADAARFITVYDLGGQGASVAAVEAREEAGSAEGRLAVDVEISGERWRITLDVSGMSHERSRLPAP